MTSMENKLQKIQEHLSSKRCFGLAFLAAAEASGCGSCHIRQECEGSREERLIYEEASMHRCSEMVNVDAEIEILDVPSKQAEVEVVEAVENDILDDDAPIPDREEAEALSLVGEMDLPNVRTIADWNWNEVLANVLKEHPTTYRNTFNIIFKMMPAGSNKNKGYHYTWSLLDQLRKRGIITWTGIAADPLTWNGVK